MSRDLYCTWLHVRLSTFSLTLPHRTAPQQNPENRSIFRNYVTYAFRYENEGDNESTQAQQELNIDGILFCHL